jgi:hypothetical protein
VCVWTLDHDARSHIKWNFCTILTLLSVELISLACVICNVTGSGLDDECSSRHCSSAAQLPIKQEVNNVLALEQDVCWNPYPCFVYIIPVLAVCSRSTLDFRESKCSEDPKHTWKLCNHKKIVLGIQLITCNRIYILPICTESWTWNSANNCLIVVIIFFNMNRFQSFLIYLWVWHQIL